ncbi:hypothetical protein ACK280_16110 [Mycobacterium sherrisii]|uniref:hypothetical protein n=1 Tax=Mycobacterium sherrisii TaxID=243061 RepID=UPI0039758CD5
MQSQQLRRFYRSDPRGSTPSGAATLDAAVDSVTMGAAEEAALLNPSRPEFMWTANAKHCWFGLSVPRSGYGIENPDDVYRHVAVDDSSSYVIRGRLARHPARDLTFVLYGEIPGTGAVTQEGAPILASLDVSQMQVGADGTFIITVGPSPANGQTNHIQTTKGASLIIVRDSLSDWGTELPSELTVARESGPGYQESSFPGKASLAAQLASKIGRYWVQWNNKFIYPMPVNSIPAPPPRPIGFATAGYFGLGNQQALVVTVDPKKAQYVGFQLADPWGVALEYTDHTGSLNNSQAKANGDGSLTYVISAADPGVWNWLDTSGLSAGTLAIRWQAVPPGTDATGAVRSVTLVALADLPSALPPGTTFVNREQRRGQLAARSASYERRLTGR